MNLGITASKCTVWKMDIYFKDLTLLLNVHKPFKNRRKKTELE